MTQSERKAYVMVEIRQSINLTNSTTVCYLSASVSNRVSMFSMAVLEYKLRVQAVNLLAITASTLSFALMLYSMSRTCHNK